MLVLHVIWDNSTLEKHPLYIWAEDSDLAGKPGSSAPPGRKPAGNKTVVPASKHPFTVQAPQLKEALHNFTPPKFLDGAVAGTFTLRLPSDKGGPLPSPELILEEERGTVGKVGLTGWEISCLAFTPEQGLDLLLKFPAEFPANITSGSSMRFWMEAAKFVLEILTQQNFEPAILKVKTGAKTAYRSGWRMGLSEEADLTRLETLYKSMPPVCRAFVPEPGATVKPGGTGQVATPVSPSELLNDFLNRTLETTLQSSFQAAGVGLAPSSNQKPGRSQPKPAGDLPAQWLQGLYSREQTPLSGPTAEMKPFLAEMEDWLGQLKPVDRTTPFRTCFKLEPLQPDTTNESEAYLAAVRGAASRAPASPPPWLLTFYLQANSDRSLLIEADQVWRERSGTLTFLKRQFENPQERLLADLGKASRMYPTLDKSLKSARPVGLTLDTEEAYTFLRQSAPLLEQSGFGVILPPWWSKPSQKLGLKLRMTAKGEGAGKTSSGLLSKEKLVEYDWQLALGDQPLSMAEFEKLARLKVPLVQLRGQWVEVRPEQIEAAIAFFDKQHAKGQMTLEEALKLGLGQDGLNDVAGLSVNGVESDGWIGELLERLSQSSKIADIPQPAGLQANLRPYQLKGLSWLSFLGQYELGACLADDMGLGKTIQLISLLLHERENSLEIDKNGNGKVKGKGNRPKAGKEKEKTKVGPTLLVCPMSVVGNWTKELARFAPSLRLLVHHGGQRLSGPEFEEAVARADVVLTTYALLSRDEEELSGIEWERVALDEAQNIKNQSAKQTQAVRRLQTRYRVALTGTPMENRLSELWSIMHFLNPGYLGTATEFRTRYGTPIEKYHDQARSEQLKKLIQPFVLRRLKTDKSIIADLPDKMEMKVWCNLTREQASLYEAVVKDMVAQIEEAAESGIQRRGLILATLLKLKQVCNHPAHFMGDRTTSDLANRSGKLARLEEMLEEALEEGDKALIFSQFAEMGSMLKPYLQQRLGREVLFLHGGTSRKLRDEMVQRFQDTRPGSPPIFLLSLKAGGVGLNLTAANHVFHFDRWWNPAVENQATDRAFRIGQQKNVQVHKFVCIGTLEERIDTMIEQKKGLADSIVGQSENWITDLSNRELRQLFALDRTAIGD